MSRATRGSFALKEEKLELGLTGRVALNLGETA